MSPYLMIQHNNISMSRYVMLNHVILHDVRTYECLYHLKVFNMLLTYVIHVIYLIIYHLSSY